MGLISHAQMVAIMSAKFVHIVYHFYEGFQHALWGIIVFTAATRLGTPALGQGARPDL